MTDVEAIGQILNVGMQAGAIQNVGHSDGGAFDVLEPGGDGWRFFFTFNRATGAAQNLTLDEMKAALADKGVTA